MQAAVIILLTLFAGGLHLYWRRRVTRLQADLQRQCRENTDLEDHCQQTVIREHAQQEALFNSMAEGVLILDSHQRVRMVNRALRDLFDMAEELQGRSLMETFRLHELQELVLRAAAEESSVGMELNLPGPPSRLLQVSATVFRNQQDQPQGTILVFHDLTRLKQLENLRQEFVANVSHELRTPLSMIKGYVETLIEGAKEDPATAERFLGIIQRHVNRLTFLIEDLLTLSQLESGRAVFNFHPVDLHELVDHLLEDLSARAAERKARLLNEVPAGLQARADADRLQQVFFNLVENAIKYGHLEGRVVISAARVGTMIEVQVQDDGPGIPPEAATRVFERFYRVDRARSRDQGGTGLGLAIVKHIVQSHEGKVWVKSEMGRGTAFFFTLPVAE